MSFGNNMLEQQLKLQHQLLQQHQLQQQLQQQQQQELPVEQHPLLSAISGNNYAETQRAHYPWLQHYERPLAGVPSNHKGTYASASSGHSGYGGMDPNVEYEVQQTPPSGSYSSYHPSGGSAPAFPPHSHHSSSYSSYGPPKSPSTTPKSKKKKKSASSVMSALTLLAFFFFVNMLQSCIKEHITDMNPTVMVLTANGNRNRFNKLAEMNSREQTSSPASTTESVGAAASWQQPELVPVPTYSSAVVPMIVTPAVTLHTPYSSGLMTNKPALHSHTYQQSPPQYHHQQQQQQQHQQHHDDFLADNDYNYGHRKPTSSTDFYPNRTHIDQSLRPDSDYYQHEYYPERERDRHQHHYLDRGYAWSYGANGNSDAHSSRYTNAAGNKRYSSSASLGAQSGVSSYSDNARYRQHHYDHHRQSIDNQRHDDDVDFAALAVGIADADADGRADADGDHRRQDFYTRNY